MKKKPSVLFLLLGRFRGLRDALHDRLQSWLAEESMREAVLQEAAAV